MNQCLSRPSLCSIFLVSLATITLLTSGCKNVRIKTESTRELTGLFDNDHDRFMVAMRGVAVDKTTLKDLENIGVKNGVKNIKFWEGYQAAVHLPDGDSKITVMINPTSVLEDIAKFRNLILVRIPFERVTTTSKRIYFSNNFREVKGYDATFSFLINNGIVIYTALEDKSPDRMQQSHSFGRGFIELFGEITGPVGGVMKAIP